MGNINYITDGSGNNVGTLDLGLASFFVVEKIIKKYIPDFNLFTIVENKTINEVIEKVYNNCTKAENIQMLLFINEESDYSKKDLPAFNKAIKQYPKEWPKSPLEIIKTVKKWLIEHEKLHQSYKHTTTNVIVNDNCY